MATSPELPADPGVADFDVLQEDPARWIGVVAALGARYADAPAVPAGDGTVLVALLGHSKLESTVRYLGIEVDDALEISEQTEI